MIPLEIKNHKKLIITSVVVLAVLSLGCFLLTKVDWKFQLGSIVKKQINNRLNAELNFDNFDFNLSHTYLLLSFDNLSLVDSSSNPIIKANQLSVDIDIKQILALKIKLRRIASEYLQIRAVRDQELKWNLEQLLKPKAKLFSFSYGEFDFNNIDLEVVDLLSSKQVNYQGLHLDIKPERGHYDINIETQETEANYIKAFGMVPRSKKKNLLQKQSKLKLKVVNLEPLSINLISALLVSNPKISNLIDSYIAGSNFSIDFDYDNYEKTGKLLSVKSRVDNLKDIRKMIFESHVYLTKDIKIEKTYLSFDETELDLTGTVEDWQEPNGKLNLVLDLVDLNLFDVADRFPELEKYIPSFILEIFNILHGNDYLNGRLIFGSLLSSPELIAKLKINTKKKRLVSLANRKIVPTILNEEGEITARLRYEGSKIEVKEFDLPIDYSRVSVKGDYDLNEHSFKIKLVSDDLPLLKLAPIAASIPLLQKYKALIERSAISGYTSLDLNITRLMNHKKQLETVVQGPCRFANLNYRSLDYPLILKDINASFDINGQQIVINNLGGYIYNPNYPDQQAQNYIEAKGDFNLSGKSLAHLNIVAPKIDAQTLLDSGVIALLSPKIKLDSASGSFEDVVLQFDRNGKELDLDLDMHLEQIDIISRKQSVNDLQGNLAYRAGRIQFDNLSFVLNDNSSLLIDGSIASDLTKPDLRLEAKQLNFINTMNLIDGSSFGIEALAGKFDANLKFKDEAINGNLALDKLSFYYKGLEGYPVTNVNGSLFIGKNLNLVNLSAEYGKTSIRNAICKIENYKSKDIDRSIDLTLESQFNIDDFYHLIPKSIQKFVKISGQCPLKLAVKGNKLKRNIKINADIDQANNFSFGDWFVLDKKATRFKLVSDFTMTPQLISSTKSKLVFIKDGHKTKVRSKFQIEDYSNIEELSYFVSFKTMEQDGVQDLSLLEPHIVSLQPLNLKLGPGDLSCDTFGNPHDRQTICEFKLVEAVAQKYGIGDLNAKNIGIDLLSIANEPLEVHVVIAEGDWNTIPYNKLRFDLSANGDYIFVRDLKAKVKTGIVRGQTDFNVKTLDSKFKLEGRDLPAHNLVQGIWGFGAEVPEGLVSGVFEGKTNGILPDPMFFNLVGTTNLILRDGKLSQLVLMQKVLTAVNTLHNFDLNNIFQTLVTYKGGTFDHVISSIKYDHGVMSSEKLLLIASQMELNLNGYFDYNKDQLWVRGKGLIPKKSKSILQGIGVGKVNLGNLLAMDDLNEGGSKEKRFFDFLMAGPISNPDKSAESLKSNFKWQ